MSMDYVEIDLGRPRKLKFGFKDLRDLERRLNGLPFQQVLEGLQALNLAHLVQALAVGLRWDDPKITPAKVEDLLEAYLAEGRPMARVLEALSEALIASGIVGAPGQPSGEGSRPTGA